MAIVFEEVTAEIAPPPAAAEAAPAPRAEAEPDALEQLRHTLRLLAEREARLRAD